MGASSSISFEVFKLAFKFIIVLIISRNVSQFLKPLIRYSLLIQEEERAFKERTEILWYEHGSNKHSY